MRTKIIGYGLLTLAMSTLTACLSGVTIGGVVTGLAGTGLVLRDVISGTECNLYTCYDVTLVDEALSIHSNGSFTFLSQVPPSRATNYRVSTLTHPSGQVCTVSANGYGLVPGSDGKTPTTNISDIGIQCSPSPEFNLLAGSATVSGSADGTGTAARFHGPEYPNGPGYIATDRAGNVYVADNLNRSIRKISSGGVVTTLAGMADDLVTYADGTGTTARFGGPMGIAVDNAGNVYVADTLIHAIRKITPEGVVTTLAGDVFRPGRADGAGAAASFNYPIGIAVDGAGNVYVADTGNSSIRKISPAGVVTTLAGSLGRGSDDGPAATAKFNTPTGIAVDSAGNVYVTDTNNANIRKITPEGVVTTLAGTFDNSKAIAVDSTGNVYVTDAYMHTVRKVSPMGGVTTIAAIRNQSANGIALSADKLFVFDSTSVQWAPKP